MSDKTERTRYRSLWDDKAPTLKPAGQSLWQDHPPTLKPAQRSLWADRQPPTWPTRSLWKNKEQFGESATSEGQKKTESGNSSKASNHLKSLWADRPYPVFPNGSLCDDRPLNDGKVVNVSLWNHPTKTKKEICSPERRQANTALTDSSEKTVDCSENVDGLSIFLAKQLSAEETSTNETDVYFMYNGRQNGELKQKSSHKPAKVKKSRLQKFLGKKFILK